MSDDQAALLRAIEERPDDDTPRLVFADWLDEQGDDASVARAEFIRLGCKMAEKTRLSVAEGKWLDKNWRRLLPGLMSVMPTPIGPIDPVQCRRSGRWLDVRVNWVTDKYPGAIYYHHRVRLEYWRGFARTAEFSYGIPFRAMAAAVAADEPLAVFRPVAPPFVSHPARLGNGYQSEATVLRDEWSPEVFGLLTGHVHATTVVKTWQGRCAPEAMECPLRAELYAELSRCLTLVARQWAR